MIAVAAIGKDIKTFALWGQKVMAEINDATKDCINNDPDCNCQISCSPNYHNPLLA